MKNDNLWAPWRLDYVTADSEDRPPQKNNCFLCQYISEDNDEKHWIVRRTEHTVTILNRYPYNNGHLMVAPLEHIGEFAALSPELLSALMLELQTMTGVLRETMNPDGFNIGLNLGRVAGAGLPGHLHWHIVPRWNGDANFMPVVADTKVIPQSLAACWKVLRDGLNLST